MINIKNLNSFLDLGYFLEYKDKKEIININIEKIQYYNLSKKELIELASEHWSDSISNKFENNNNNILVPLSGGLDSRAILGGLLDHTDANNIHTYTFGVPGALDYEIGNMIAKKIGTRHVCINLNDYSYSIEELIKTSKRVDHQTLLFFHDPIYYLDEYFDNFQIWKGYLGETLTGSHLPKSPAYNLKDAKKYFIEKNRFVKSIDLKCPNYNYYNLIEHNNKNVNGITLEEQLDFINRQTKYIYPHVVMQGYKYQLPFIDEKIIKFFLSIDDSYRYKQNLYKDMLLFLYPELFSIPTTSNSGFSLKANKSKVFIINAYQYIKNKFGIINNKRINYFNIKEKMNNDYKFRKIIKTCIYELKERKIIDWIDIEKIYKSDRNNYSDALLVLASLELHLKSGKSI